MGDVKKWVNAGGLWDPAGSINRVAVQNSSHPIGGTAGNLETQQQNKAINIHNILDPGGNQRQQSTGIQGSADPINGKPNIIHVGNPNSPGSIYNLRGQGVPFNPNIGVPTNGISTNGFNPPMAQIPQNGQPLGGFNPQGGTPNMGMQNSPPGVPQNGVSTNGLNSSPNWADIIGRALRNPQSQQTVTQGMPAGAPPKQ